MKKITKITLSIGIIYSIMEFIIMFWMFKTGNREFPIEVIMIFGCGLFFIGGIVIAKDNNSKNLS